MSKYTFRQKLDYNLKHIESDFSKGYVDGARAYFCYLKFRGETKKLFKLGIDSVIKQARRDKDPKSKGFACAVRDAAEDRKKNF